MPQRIASVPTMLSLTPAHDNFNRPMGVLDAERLSTVVADTALFIDMRDGLAYRDQIIADLRSELNAKPARLRFVRSFDDLSTPFATIAEFCTGLRAAGSEPVMEWHGDVDGKVWLTISVACAA